MNLNHLYAQPKEKRAILKLQAWVIGKQERKRYKVLLKKAKYRKNVISELINTEIAYVADLQVIINKVLQPIRERNNILTHDNQQKIFLNLEQISKFNKEFLQVLQASYVNYYPYAVVFQESNKLIDGFHYYFDYCNGFQGACKLQDQFKDNVEWMNFLSEIRRSNILRGMDLQSFLVKPVQRLPKYVLLYKDLLKHTDDKHPDYINIDKGLKSFMQVNEENNKNMDKFLSRLRLEEIQQTLNLSQNELLKDHDRLFRFEETLTLITGDIETSVIVYALTDMVIIAERGEGNPKLVMTLYMNSLSFMKDQSDSKYFEHLFSIVTNEGVALFKAESNQTKYRMIGVFDQLIDQLREIERKKIELKTGKPMVKIYPVQVVVLGTEERAYQSFQKHTVYITEITISKIALKIFARYSEIKQLHQRIKHDDLKKTYSQVTIQEFPVEQWIQNHKTKVIEARKLSIESFLQLILQAEVTRTCNAVLEAINLPQRFYDLPQIYDDQQNAKFQGQQIGPKTRLSMIPFQKAETVDAQSHLAKMGIDVANLQKSAGEVLKAFFLDREQYYIVKRRQKKIAATTLLPSQMAVTKGGNLNGLYKIEIHIPDGSSVKLGISPNTRAKEIVDAVAQEINIRYSQDYRLYILDKLHNYRIIDEDEVVKRVIHEETKNEGFVKGIFNKVEQLLASSKDDITFHFKKYIFLPQNLEEHDFKTDPVRMRQMAFQILDFVKSEKFQLQFNDYCVYAAIYYHMKYPEIASSSNIDTQQIDKIVDVVPTNIYKTTSEKLWVSTTRQLIKQIKQQIDIISAQNRTAVEKGQKQEYQILIESSHIAYQIAYNSIKQNKLSGTGVYHVETHPKTMQWMQKTQLIYPNIYLGVSLRKLHYLSPSKKEEFKSFDFNKITSIKSYPMQIIFEFENYKEDQIVRFNTYQSNEIKNLIEMYKHIQQFDKDFELSLQKKA